MAYKFTLTEKIRDYVRIDEDEWKHVDVEKKYAVNSYDDLQNLLLTLVDFSEDGKPLRFEIKKEVVEEVTF